MNCIESDNIIYLLNRDIKMSEDPNEVTTYSESFVHSLLKEKDELNGSLEICKKANSELKTNIDNLNAQFKQTFENLMCELDASKQMYNESLNAHFQLRTANISLQKKMQAYTEEIAQLKESLLKKD